MDGKDKAMSGGMSLGGGKKLMAYTPPPLTANRLEAYHRDPMLFRREQIIMDGGRSFAEALEPWQVESFFGPLDVRDSDGMPSTKLSYLCLPKGWGKSSTAAIYLITCALLVPGLRAYLVSGDKDEAEILAAMARGFIQRNPGLTEWFKTERYRLMVPALDSEIRVTSTDITQHGVGGEGRAYLLVIDELHVFESNSDREVLELFLASAGKKPWSQALILTNAGRPDSLAYELMQTCQQGGEGLYYWSPGPEDPRPAWITQSFLDMQRRLLPTSSFARWHLGTWTAGGGDVFTEEEIKAIFDPDLSRRRLTLSEPVISIDLGLVRDRAALAVVAADMGSGDVVVLELMSWQGSKSRRVDIEEDIEVALVEAIKRFGIRPKRGGRSYGRIVLDPWQLIRTGQALTKQGYEVREWTASGASLSRMSQIMLNLIRAGRLKAEENDVFKRELEKLCSEEKSYGFKLVHSGGSHDDLFRAVAMAAMELEACPTANPYSADNMRCDRKSFAMGCGAPDHKAGPCAQEWCGLKIGALAVAWWRAIGCPAGGEVWKRCCGAGVAGGPCPVGEACSYPVDRRGDPRAGINWFLVKARPFGNPPEMPRLRIWGF